MAELNEEQLLLLSNLMYYHADGSGNSGSVADICRDILSGSDSELKSRLSGGFEDDIGDMKDIAEAILSDPQMSSLQVADTVDKNNVYATCFVDANGEATVAVRGTGGSYRAWKDNIQAAYDDDTLCQETMLDFANKLKKKGYSDITITGHSKGGNMAQYVTLLSDDLVDRCISFDGQGFNDHFIEKYKDEIAQNSGKIKSICAKNDYVSILLNTVAGETVYLNNSEDGFGVGHSPYTLWKTNKGDLKYGQYATPVEQDPMMAQLEVLADKFCDDVNSLPWFLKQPLVDNIGSIVAIIFAIDSGKFELGDLLELILDELSVGMARRVLIRAWLIKELAALAIYVSSGDAEKEVKKRKKEYNSVGHVPVEFMVNCNLLNNTADKMERLQEMFSEMIMTVDDVHFEGRLFDPVKKQIRTIRRRLSAHLGDMLQLEKALQKSAERYNKCEVDILENAETLV